MTGNYCNLELGQKPTFVSEIRKKFDSRIKDRILIVVLGESGTGKSRLINSLLGKTNMAKEGHSLNPETLKTSPYKIREGGIEIILYDTPGLDGTVDEVEKTTRSIEENVDGEVNLFLWCVPMNTTIIGKREKQTFKIISTVFEPNFLTKTIVTLTFANLISGYGQPKVEDVFSDTMSLFEQKYCNYQIDSSTDDIGTDIPVVAVGDSANFILPGCDNWLQSLSEKVISFLQRSGRLQPNLSDLAQTNTHTQNMSEAFRYVKSHLADHQNYGNYVNLLNMFEKFLTDGRKSITFILVGKTGTGKSRLVNALIGKDIAKEGHQLNSETKQVTPYVTTKECVTITVWDTPGFEDGCSNEEYLHLIAAKVEKIDLLIFCASMNDTRIRAEDMKTVKIITEAFGGNIWRNGMVALTFANVLKPPSEITNELQFFQERLTDFEEEYNKVLANAKAVIPVPLVPVGDLGLPKHRQLPGCKDWVPQFWLCAFQRTDRAAKPAMIQINYSRLRFDSDSLPDQAGPSTSETSEKEEDFVNLDKEQQQTFLNDLWPCIKEAFPSAIKTAPAGATIGAFFPLPGAPVIGAGVAVLVSFIINCVRCYRKHKSGQ